jgi:dihydrodiol dehydrogenase / D-xylose 1-dehydrogenase (NADP)
MEAMWTYFLPAVVEVQKWIEDGLIGKVKYIKADFGFKANVETAARLFDYKNAGGALLDIGIYPIALAWLIYKQLPKKVSVISKKADTGVDAEETMIFEYPDGELANLGASIVYHMPNEAVIIGDQGYIRIPDFFMAKECFLYKNGELKNQFADPSKCVGYNYEVDAVNMDLLEGNKESAVVPLVTSLKLQYLMSTVKKLF